MRVIAGRFRGRTLRSLRGLELRPTADRLRETLFDILIGGNPLALERTEWLDLYAGTGAVGIEALSRGADMVRFVESSAKAAELVRQNLKALNIEGGFEVLQLDVGRALHGLAARKVGADFVFVDPPYRMEAAYGQTLQNVSQLRLLKPGGIVIAEHRRRFDPGEEFGGLQRYRKLVQGDAALSFYRD
jgi:16S rRNA (guanine966-N2)-methyltransferase